MRPRHRFALLSFALAFLLSGRLPAQPSPPSAAPKPPAVPAASGTNAVATPPAMAEILAASAPGDWREIDPENTLYVELPAGRVVIELAPTFAPHYVANVKTLARAGYYDGLVILRSQDNYVVEWGDVNAGEAGKARSFGTAQQTVRAELDRPNGPDLPFTPLPDGDVYAPQVGHSLGFPVARDPQAGRTWLAHCYGMVGAGRGETVDSGSGAELYVVIGHSPRHLDRNVTLLGRVVQGMELLSTYPRGSGPMGFYTATAEHPPLKAVRVAADVPEAQRLHLEALRTDTPTFQKLIGVRRTRPEAWFVQKAGKIDLCNVPLPVRVRPAAATASH